MKSCTNKNCKQENPQPLENFHKDSTTKDGLKFRCKKCLTQQKNEKAKGMREELKLKQQEYYKNNSEIQKQSSNNWKNKNKEQQKDYWQKWYLENKQKRKIYFIQYQKNNPNIIKEKSRRRRDVKLNAIGSFTELEFTEKLKKHNYKCFWCGKKMNSNETTRDHYIPLTRGGSDYIENIVPCCYSCNCKKRNRMPNEYLRIIGNHEPNQRN